MGNEGGAFTNSVGSAAIEQFARLVMGWYSVNKRSFPWRVGMVDGWTTALTAILLRKTRAETVAKHYAKVIQALASPKHVLSLSLENIEELLKPLGLYRTRARQIHRLAQAWGEGGRLPGIGPYAISLMECLHRGKLVPIIDVNTKRVVERVFGAKGEEAEGILRKSVEAAGTCELNLAVMDLAAKVCTSRKPKCSICPLSSLCHHARGGALEVRRKRTGKRGSPPRVGAPLEREGCTV